MQIFDIVRKKFVLLSPEEWVRQHIIHYIISNKHVPLALISVEKQVILNGTKKRTDVVVYDSSLKPMVIIECKAPDVPVNQSTINQIMRYNLTLNVPYIFVSNGNTHISLKAKDSSFIILNEFPAYEDICNHHQ